MEKLLVSRKNKLLPLVSIIVPIYNAEKYLGDCLQSILDQTYKLIEVILVDDRSEDNSRHIAEDYAEKDKRIRLIFKDSNQGINQARKTGFQKATGEYIMFVDDDDIIARSLVKEHLDALAKTGADVSISKAFWWNDNDELEVKRIYNQGSGDYRVLNKKLSYRSLITETSPFSDSEVGMLWNKLHKRKFFEGYSWDLSNMPAEDFMTNAHLFIRADSIVYIDRVHYFHRVNSHSTMNQLKHKKGANAKQEIDIFDGLFKVVEVFSEVSKENSWNFNNEILYFKYRYFYIRIKAFIVGNSFSEADFLKIQKYTSLDEIDRLCSDEFHRYISEFAYYPAVNILQEVVQFWDIFSRSKSATELLERIANQLITKSHQDDARIEHLLSHIARLNDRLDNIQSFRGSMFNFLGKIKHRVVLRAVRMPRKAISYYKEAQLEKKYKDCWLIMDREESASDNGYALYKYLLEKHPEINAYFAISRDSGDVTKLQEEGFRLVFVGSNEHKIAIRNSKKLFYSYFTFEYSNEEAQRIFLGHGITKDDLPNPGLRSSDYFITAIDREQDYLSERTDLRAIKVGLPRYERLVEKLKYSEEIKDSIIIAPTWRSWLYLDSHQTKKNGYFINWQRFLDSKELKALSHEHKIIFILHPMMNEANSFNVPEYIESNTYSNLGLDGLQDLLVKTELLITDYSSIAFDATVAGANIMYFQFDRKDFRRKGKLKTGWFSYEADGFGPVYDEYDAFIYKVKDYKGVTSEEYQRRSQLFRDEIVNTTGASKRLVQIDRE